MSATTATLTRASSGATLTVVRHGTQTFTESITAEELGSLTKSFSAWNGGDAVTPDAFVAAMRLLAERQGKPFSEERARKAFALSDIDGDGRVDFAECE